MIDIAECKWLLAVAAKLELVGRIGIATEQAPVVIPVNFTMHDGQIRIRVGTGFLLGSAAGHLVAFEVDHVEPVAGWAWSVLARGLATVDEHPDETALTAGTQPLVPEPGDRWLTIRPDVLTGRRFALATEQA